MLAPWLYPGSHMKTITTRALQLTSALFFAALAACPAAAPPSAPAPAQTGLAGRYTIAAASNPGGKGGYSGSVDVENVGDHVSLAWNIPNVPAYKGVGVVVDGVLGVGWGTGSAYGVAVYKVVGGKLTGTWANMSQSQTGTENLEGPPGLNGSYTITSATLPESKKGYTGTVLIVPNGATHTVTWTLPNDSYSGVGILRGDVFVVGWGIGGNAGAVAYGVSPGKLDGSWATPGGTALGGETLQKN